MFNIKDFQDNQALKPIILKLNKFLEKNKIAKVPKLIKQLESLIEHPDNDIPASFALSMIAENHIEFISEGLIQKIELFLHSDKNNLRINSIVIIGFYILANLEALDKYFLKFTELIVDKNDDVRDNLHYFLATIFKKKPMLIHSKIDLILRALALERNEENIINLINYLNNCEEFDFKQHYEFREISKSILTKYNKDRASNIFSSLIISIKKFFPSLKEANLENYRLDELIKLLDDQFLMKKFYFSDIQKEKKTNFKNFIKDFKKTRLKNKEIYFYMKNREKNDMLFFEIEKDKLLNFFEKNEKISREKLKESFPILENDSVLKLFIKTLLKLDIINGFFSKFYFYSIKYIRTKITEDILKKGIVNLKNYNIFPLDLIKEQMNQVANSTNQKLLIGKTKKIYYSLSKIQEQINLQAAKTSSIDLKSYRARLSMEDFIKLIKSLPKEYLSNYHMGTQWLTNLGLLKIKKEIENSKIVGFYDINKISEKLNVSKLLLIDVLDLYVDDRSGIFDKTKNIFYYSKFINERIDKIKSFSDKNKVSKNIDFLAIELNIDKEHILIKLDENKQLIGEQIKKQDQITIIDYLEKTGMVHDEFIRYINDLELTFFKKGDYLIFNPKKIEDEKREIKLMLIQKSKSVDQLSLGNLDITSYLVEKLIKDLVMDEKIKGIFHEEGGEILFYTERGIRNLMLENSFIFSFYDLFYDKELSDNEITFLRNIFDDLVKERKLKGLFDEETLTFSSDDVVFAKDYNSFVAEFENRVNKYVNKFDNEFQKIKKILLKRKETIYPQEIKVIQESIDKINEKYVFWDNYLEHFIHKANSELLSQQGFTVKKYKGLTLEKKNEIKYFEEDPDIHESLNGFKLWVKLFNDLEILYGNVIFYQKRFINNPDDKESEKKFNELLERLNLNA